MYRALSTFNEEVIGQEMVMMVDRVNQALQPGKCSATQVLGIGKECDLDDAGKYRSCIRNYRKEGVYAGVTFGGEGTGSIAAKAMFDPEEEQMSRIVTRVLGDAIRSQA
ncbi:UNVERIFIED_CONTAM: hypothetical protein PYX00_003968 [Menopon gallinae]|uniref:Uncharacterized protein n=1 Tax=Menopon gallinae TaxID=328185 RepID=A0AAW2I3Y7_9NEOP